MRPRRSLVVAALLLVAPFAPHASAAPARLPALPGILPLHLQGAADLGPAPSAVPQQVVLVLKLRDRAGLTKLLHDQQTAGTANYRRWLTPSQFAARFSPTTSVVAAARAWAAKAGLRVSEVSPNRTLVTLDGTAATVGRAFGVELRAARLGGQAFVTPDRAAVLPASLRSSLASVLGLTTYHPNRLPTLTVRRQTPYQTYGLASYGPADFAAIYHAPSSVTGTGQSVAVITDGDLRQVSRDLRTFETRFRLRAVPLTVVQTDAPSTDTSGAMEYALDSQYSLGFAPGVKRVIAYNGNALGDIHPLNRAVTDRVARTVSASYGGCESLNFLLGFVDAADQVFQQALAQGQTFWTSSGDEGSSCTVLVNTGTPAGVPSVQYPASSPYVVGVGGTTLTGSSSQPTREVAWVGGGGGYSNVESAPSWQTSHGTFVKAVGRGVPDVSLDADPSSGYTVIIDGQPTTIGGTSAGTPAWNGIWARVLQKHPRFGFAAPLLYRAPAGALVDITLGSNGLWAAASGYDLSTGLGSADITGLVTKLR
ncbi:MAG: peptidase [Frankiales bacterium]|nr:peptidase [Frankiales bacterium]